MTEISIAFLGQDKKLLCQFLVFCSSSLSFYAKATNNFLRTLSSQLLERNSPVAGVPELETTIVLCQLSHSPSVSGQETLVKVSGSTNLLFRKKRPIKLKILTFLPTQKIFFQVFKTLNWKPWFSFVLNFP